MTQTAMTLLGDPAPNAPKWFAAVEMIRLATDQDWLRQATEEIAKIGRTSVYVTAASNSKISL